MSFVRHRKIYRSEWFSRKWNTMCHFRPDSRFDESSAGYSLSGCAPAEPDSASPVSRSFTLFSATVHPTAANGNLSLISLSHPRGAFQNHDGWSSGEMDAVLKAPRSRVSAWLRSLEQEGWPALREGERPGRPPLLDLIDRQRLADLVDSGPTAYGFLSGVWISPRIARVIEEESGVRYHPGQVCRLLHQFGFSVPKPRKVMIRANAAAQQRWSRSVYPALRGVCDRQRAALVFADQASIRQDSTLHRTWARRGQRPAVPVTGTRKSLKGFCWGV